MPGPRREEHRLTSTGGFNRRGGQRGTQDSPINVDRRKFLAGVAVAGAATAVTPQKTPIAAPTPDRRPSVAPIRAASRGRDRDAEGAAARACGGRIGLHGRCHQDTRFRISAGEPSVELPRAARRSGAEARPRTSPALRAVELCARRTARCRPVARKSFPTPISRISTPICSRSRRAPTRKPSRYSTGKWAIRRAEPERTWDRQTLAPITSRLW